MTIKASAITYTTPGPDFDKVLSLTDFEIDSSNLKSNQIVLKTLATPVNPSDLVQISGIYPSPPKKYQLGSSEVIIGGNEGLYKIIATGSCITKYKVGDWVIPKLPSFGTWRTHALVTVEGDDPFIKVSSDEDTLTLSQAATISINPPTAYQLIHQFISDWNDGDWIIQNAGNSQVGKYVTQISRSENIKTISVIRSGKSKEEIDELYDLGATKVITDEELLSGDFKQKLSSWIGNDRVRLALNSIGGPSVAGLVSSLSQDGVLATFGSMGDETISYSSHDQLFKNLRTVAYWLTANTKKNPQSKIDTVNSIIKLYKDGHLKEVPFNKSKYSQGDNLFDIFLNSIKNSSKGKQVVVYN